MRVVLEHPRCGAKVTGSPPSMSHLFLSREALTKDVSVQNMFQWSLREVKEALSFMEK